jgi:hypothetical protein
MEETITEEFFKMIRMIRKITKSIDILRNEKIQLPQLFLIFYFSLFLSNESFEHYFSSKDLITFLKDLKRLEKENDYQILFFISLLQKSHSQKDNSFLKKLTFLFKWKGLSTTGIQVGSDLGFLVHPSTLLRFEKEQIKNQNEKIENLKKDNTFLLFWLDNFNRIFKKNNLSIKGKNENFQLNNLTAIGANIFWDKNNITTINFSDKLLTNEIFLIPYQKILDFDSEYESFFKNNNYSFQPINFKNLNIYLTNIKKDIFEENISTNLEEVEEFKNSNSNFFPLYLEDLNIQSNDDFEVILDNLEKSFGSKNKIFFLNLDCANFKRAFKVNIIFKKINIKNKNWG